MTDLPRDPWPDATLPLLRDPYRYVPRRAAALGSNVFRLRLMGQVAYAMTGRAAAEAFYDADRFSREGAIPRVIGAVLFGPKGVIQGTDGAEHLHRKTQAMGLMDRDAPGDLAARLIAALDDALPGLAGREVELFETAGEALTTAICGWAGVPLAPDAVPGRARTLWHMFLDVASKTPAGQWRARRARRDAQAWIEPLIAAIRAGRSPVPDDAPLARAARWTHADGRPLALDVAAADMLSFLRPPVANAVWIVHMAHALHRHPAMADGVATDADFRDAFVREVRRVYPFFPVLGAVAGPRAAWRGAPLKPGARVVLSIWGTNRDPDVWSDPEAFDPARHMGREAGPFDMIAQGGGDFLTGHRCAGEWVTVQQMAAAAEWLTTRGRHAVTTPGADPHMARPPALPRDGFRVRFTDA